MSGRRLSAQTLSLLFALERDPAAWRHGYDLAKETGLRSGTLYPVLVRLADRGLVQARWEDEQPAGRPRRHLYRLTADGLAATRAARAEERSRSHRPAQTSARRRLRVEEARGDGGAAAGGAHRGHDRPRAAEGAAPHPAASGR